MLVLIFSAKELRFRFSFTKFLAEVMDILRDGLGLDTVGLVVLLGILYW